MSKGAFRPADILLPRVADLSRWSVIACDQFTSDPDYWARVEEYVGTSPSTLRLMLPEARLDSGADVAAERIRAEMDRYLEEGLFRTLEHAYIYLEREITGGQIRRGLLGAIDLEFYDYREDVRSPVNPTEGIVRERLPARLEIRRSAIVEMPHIMVFIDDPEFTVIEPIIYDLDRPDRLYDFDLMEGGGHLTGWEVSGGNRSRVDRALAALSEKRGGAPLFAVGDGNHSLAAAKLYWEQLRESLSPEERENHPARFCLAELVNLHDAAIRFEPIHRTLFQTDTEGLAEALQNFMTVPGSGEHSITVVTGDHRTVVNTGLSLGELIAATDRFAEQWLAAHGGRVDYVHGDAEAEQLAEAPGCCSILLPAMQKTELFPGLEQNGPFPKKSFSVGHARDKRYYLECRRIR